MTIATIEKIQNIRVHPNAEALELATIKGWQICVKKNEFKTGDLCVFVTVDSVLGDFPQYEFLRNKNFRIKTVKLRGELSQGIAFPISLLASFGHDIIPVPENGNIEGTDVSELIHAKHYEKPIPPSLAGQIVGHRPSFIKKTDEDNLKNYPQFIDELQGKPYVITLKFDGQSSTYFVKEEHFGVCSRNLELKYDSNNALWKIAEKYSIESHIRNYFGGKNIALQGEIYGPGIQENLLGADEISFAAFNLFDIDTQSYMSHCELEKFTKSTNIPMVNVLDIGDNFSHTLEYLQTFANGLTYDSGKPAEGIVIRSQTETRSSVLNGRMSGKVVSEVFELKYG